MTILLAMWDTLFHSSADGITETLIWLIHIRLIRWQQSPGKFVCESNIVAPLGHCFTGLLGTEQANLGGVISES